MSGALIRESRVFFIGGQWVKPTSSATIDVINPATEAIFGRVASGSAADADAAVGAARAAFGSWSRSTRAERLDMLYQIAACYDARAGDLADALTEEMGAPRSLANGPQVQLGASHFRAAARVLEHFQFEEQRGTTLIVREPIGVAAMITPWNWPLHQIGCKVAPAIATGCTMVLKPSEISPFTGAIFAEILGAAGVPAGVFNLVQGDGPGVGARLAEHPDVDLVTFTGSARGGIAVACGAAPTIKRVTQELGGKSAYIALDDQSFAESVAQCVRRVMLNSGQSCNAPTRLLVPAERLEGAVKTARGVVDSLRIGDPAGDVDIGPVASLAQWERVQSAIISGMAEGARLVVGGAGKPEGLERGFFVRPTVFADVHNDMSVAREEIFGPVLCILTYSSIDDAIAIANDSPYGLSASVNGDDLAVARSIARRLRAGEVLINGAWDIDAPFGGYRQSGNGREKGEFGFHDYLEVKAIAGYGTS